MPTTEHRPGTPSPVPPDARPRPRTLRSSSDDTCHCDFPLAPPRHFHYPAILLLLAEEPRHGYALVEALRCLGFGPISRPSVYRALADLERDRLLISWDAAPLAGSTRHVYAVTDGGQTQLAAWMDVMVRERDALDGIVDRYTAQCDGAAPPVDEAAGAAGAAGAADAAGAPQGP